MKTVAEMIAEMPEAEAALATTSVLATARYLEAAKDDPMFAGKSADYWEGFKRGAAEIALVSAKTFAAHIRGRK